MVLDTCVCYLNMQVFGSALILGAVLGSSKPTSKAQADRYIIYDSNILNRSSMQFLGILVRSTIQKSCQATRDE